jgi:RNA polymerase sigma-70 factor (ECF subfamily)
LLRCLGVGISNPGLDQEFPSHEAIVKQSVENSSSTPSRDQQAWLQEVFGRLEQPLSAYAMRLMGGDWNRAQDCVQEAFCRLCREDYHKVASHVDAWLYKTCRNHAMDIHRKEARMTIHSDSAPLQELESRETTPVQRVVQNEEQSMMEAEIARLPKLEQEVVQLRLAQGLSYKQIADVTDLSVSHVGVLLHQAVKRLRQSLGQADGLAGA